MSLPKGDKRILSPLVLLSIRQMHLKIRVVILLDFLDPSVLPPCLLFRVTLENKIIGDLSSSRHHSNSSC